MENNPQPLIMDEPKAAANEPVCVAVAANRNYSWCTCGLSEKQPFCDGRHRKKKCGTACASKPRRRRFAMEAIGTGGVSRGRL
jgi:CDGSH-type Zn-finger protein